MTSTSSTTSKTHDTSGRTLAWAVLAAAVIEVVAPVVTINGPGSSPGSGSGPELLITPVGWAFSIWGVIYALAIVQAVAALVTRADVPTRLQVDLVVLYLGGALWIALAGLDSSAATAGALLLMLVAAVDAVLTVRHVSLAPHWLSVLTQVSVGLYAGWVTAAFFLNASTASVDAGLVEAADVGWQLVVVVVAVATLMTFIVMTRGNTAFALAGTWAMIGIAVTGRSNGTDEVLVAAVVAAVVLLAVLVAVRRSGGLRRT
ncbi:hypothetical protein [Aeromicrobium endophyticum]|uniref:Uncharacterized protein n=1 Tax=Aeromicrobium endophyticum TaxID=2292704 RepID=A0A371NZ22_9ACTN|nr:hypothetical protein [Aeromicrobium endophyticum]REK68934.1 hypothetical protein DX116_18915 [Aeromicrobium endophyticum]